MKNIKLLFGFMGVVVIMASCATLQDSMGYDPMDDSRTQQVGNRLYVQDPFNGTVVLERDPYTGRYYDVTYGSRFGTGIYNYPSRVYRGTKRGYYGQAPIIQQQQRTPRVEIRQNKEETRKKVLGN